MGFKTIKNTINRNGMVYVQFRLPDKKFFKKSLCTDSHKQASVYMAQISPLISLVQSGAMTPEDLKERIYILTGASLAVERVLTEHIVNDEHKLVTRAYCAIHTRAYAGRTITCCRWDKMEVKNF